MHFLETAGENNLWFYNAWLTRYLTVRTAALELFVILWISCSRIRWSLLIPSFRGLARLDFRHLFHQSVHISILILLFCAYIHRINTRVTGATGRLCRVLWHQCSLVGGVVQTHWVACFFRRQVEGVGDTHASSGVGWKIGSCRGG